MAAAEALADLTMEDVPDSVLTAYGLSALRFGRDYLIPKPLDPRVLLWVAPAVAKAAIESGVARRGIDLAAYGEELIGRQGIGQQTRNRIIGKAKAGAKQRVLYAEGDESKVIRAATQVRDEGLAEPILIGHADRIAETIKVLGLDFQPKIVDPYVHDLRDKLAEIAISAADFATRLDIEPMVAMLSFSEFRQHAASAVGESAAPRSNRCGSADRT